MSQTYKAGPHRLELQEGWEQRPEGWGHPDVTGVAVDKSDRVYLLVRAEWPVVVYGPGGEFIRTWGKGEFVVPHGITIDADERVWIVDKGGHWVKIFDLEGSLLTTIGDGRPSETGIEGDFQTIKHGGPPFNEPTNVGFGPSGEAFIGDGYGNARIHRFDREGNLELSWGEPGQGEGEFNVPHAVTVDDTGRVLVADRENDRIQIFSSDGEVLDIWDDDICRPDDLAIHDGILYIVELGLYVGRYPGLRPDSPGDPASRISLWTLSGELVGRWGTRDGCHPGSFHAPHGIAVDSRGDIYVTECNWTGGGKDGQVPPTCHSVQKFARA